MGAKITTEIDPYLKQVFEEMKDNLGITYKDIIEEGIISKIKDFDPVRSEEIEILRLESQLSSHRLRLSMLKMSAITHVKERIATVSPELAQKREEFFEKEIKWLPKQIMRGDVNWNRILFKYEFENKKEAQAWFKPRIDRLRELGTIK